MTREEWTERTGSVPTAEQWDVVERIYTYHPDIPDVGGKDILAKTWRDKCGGNKWPEAAYGSLASYMLSQANLAAATDGGAEPVLNRRETFCSRYHVVDGYVRDEVGKTVEDVFAYVKAQLKTYATGHEEYGGIIDEYLSNSERRPGTWPIRARWIAVYAVTGGSEGHYVHVDAIEDTETGRTCSGLFLAKTFRGYDHACEIARVLGKILEV